MNRRTFLKIAGIGSVSFVAGCSDPDKTLFSLVHAPFDMVSGKATWYAATCRECPAGCGILAKNREGRVIKVEGHPEHPVNQGKICMRGQAAVQAVFHPERLTTPLLKENDRWRPLTFGEAETLLNAKIQAAARKGADRIRMMSQVTGGALAELLTATLAQWQGQAPLIFEPLAYEALKKANRDIYGIEGLPSYHLDRADVLVSLGADFLETWLSPVAYARKFKERHAYRNGQKSLFVHISPYQTITGANADLWLPCRPGSEAAVVLGLINEALYLNRGRELPEGLRSAIRTLAMPYTKDKVVQEAQIDLEGYERLLTRLIRAKSPLVLGPGTGSGGGNGLAAQKAVNLLNLILDPRLGLVDLAQRHRVENAADRASALAFIQQIQDDPPDVLLLNDVNPVYALPAASDAAAALQNEVSFVVSFANFMDETTQLADLIFPVRLPLESWDLYESTSGLVSMLQPVSGQLTKAPDLGDVLLRLAKTAPATTYKQYLIDHLNRAGLVSTERDWIAMLQKGGSFDAPAATDAPRIELPSPESLRQAFPAPAPVITNGPVFVAAPSVRFYDGRGANRPWLCELPDPLSKISWQTPVCIHPDTLKQKGLAQEDVVVLQTEWGQLAAPVYASYDVMPEVLMMPMGQGHQAYGRYAKAVGLNPLTLLPPDTEPGSGGPLFSTANVNLRANGERQKLAHLDGSRTTHDRRIALAITVDDLKNWRPDPKPGLVMDNFPMTLPLPEGYDPQRDFYPPHDHDRYRWSMVVDQDRCIGCGACSAACYAENNIGVVGLERVLEGREMAWLQVQRYLDPQQMSRVTFMPMMCQHCDNAPCESVCPVYAPHHSKEGINNQIYNRCIGTRFCVQNCPYKVRRFNWFDWQRPEPLNLQLNPDVTTRSKGVMEKCSFCVQRIKDAHNVAKNEKRAIRDGEIKPACVQTCPTDALAFGNLMDPESRVRRLVEDPRAYQVMGYLNTKPAVIYLKKVIQEV